MTELPKKLYAKLEKAFPQTCGVAGIENRITCSKLVTELYADLELAMEALERISVKPLDDRDRRIEIKYHNPYRIANEALTTLREKYKEEE